MSSYPAVTVIGSLFRSAMEKSFRRWSFWDRHVFISGLIRFAFGGTPTVLSRRLVHTRLFGRVAFRTQIRFKPLRKQRIESAVPSVQCAAHQEPFDADIHLSPSDAGGGDGSDIGSAGGNVVDQEAAEGKDSNEHPSEIAPDWQNVPIVYATGVAYKNDNGEWSAKIGVYWGDGDVSNRSKAIGNATKILAEIEAVTLALKQAVHEQHLSRLIVRTDSDYVYRCVTKYFAYWKESDFHKSDGGKVKYSEHMEELHRLLSMIEAKVEYFEAKQDGGVGNWILNKLKPPIVQDKGAIEWFSQPTSDSSSTGDTSVSNENSSSPLVMYTCGAYRDTDLVGDPFTRAGLGVYCPQLPEQNVSRRLSMYPVTLFRSQLQAIITALEQAVERKYIDVVIRTDSRVFLSCFLRQWKKVDGGLVRNYPQYLRIIELASHLRVKFELMDENAQEKSEALVLAEDGMSKPMINEAKRLFRRGASDPSGSTIRSWKVVVDSNEGDWQGVNRVCLLSEIDPETKRAMYCVYWDGENNHMSTIGSVEGIRRPRPQALRKALVLALEQASEAHQTRLIVRMDAVRLLKTVIEWIPQWRRNQWCNSLGKRVVDAEQWQYLDELMRDVEIKWEYSDSNEANDELKEVDSRAKEYLQKNLTKADAS